MHIRIRSLRSAFVPGASFHFPVPPAVACCFLLILLAPPVSPQGSWILDMAPLTNVRANRDVPLEFSIVSLTGGRLQGAQIDAILAPAESGREEFRTTAKEIKAGDYLATLKFPRPGSWNLEIKATRGASVSFRKKVEVKP